MPSAASTGRDPPVGSSRGFARAFERIDSVLDAAFWPATLAVSAALFAFFLAADFRLGLWNDELITLSVARLPGASEIAGATMQGADMTPPLYALIVHAILPFSPSEAAAIRLPSTIGLCVMFLALACYAVRRSSATHAILAGLLATAILHNFGAEGRGYGLTVGLAAVSLLLWSLASDGRGRAWAIPSLAVCVAALPALHYFALCVPACLFLALFVRARSERRFDFALAVALLLPAALVAAAHLPFIVATRPFLAHYWAVASPRALASAYQNFLKWPLVLFAAATLTATYAPQGRRSLQRVVPGMPAHERAALALIALAPVGVTGLAMITTHVFTDRYVVWASIGVALLTAFALQTFARQNPVIGVTALLLLTAGFCAKEMASVRTWSTMRESEAMLAALSSLPAGEEPIVLMDAHDFFELSHYAPAALRRRLVYPICPDLELSALGYDTDAVNLSGLRRVTEINVVACAQALPPGADVIVAVTPRGFLPWAPNDPSVTATPLSIDAAGVTLVRARRAKSPA